MDIIAMRYRGQDLVRSWFQMWRRTRPAKVTVIKPAPDGTAKVLQQLGTISLVLHNLFVPRSSPGGGRRGGEGRKLTDHRVQSEEEGESANLPHRRRDSRRRQERRMEDPEGTPPEPNTHLVCVRGGGRKGAFIGTKERSLDVSGPGSTCSAVNREQMQGSDGNESEAARGDLGPRLGPAAAGMSQQISAENCYEILTKAKSEGAEGVKELVYGFMSAHYLQVLRTPAVYGRLSAGERELILARRMEGSKVLAVAETCEPQERGGGRDGGRDGGGDGGRPQSPLHDGAQRRVFCLRQDTLQWEVLTSLPEEVPAKGSAMCTMYNYLFVAGGMDGRSKASDRVFCYNPLTGTWGQIRPLTQPRCQLRLVSMDGHLYAVGGECLFAVERYEPRTDRWTPVAPLPKGSFAVAHEATSCGGQLFVSGGSLFYRLLRYESRRDEWEECPFNESRRRSTDMVAHRSLVYRFDVDRERAGVTVYRYNTVVKAWHGGASFPLDNPQPFRCAVLGDRIYCVNRSQTLQFEVERGGFLPEVLPSPADARGALMPFVLCLNRD